MRDDYASQGPILDRILRSIADTDPDAQTFQAYADPRDDDGRSVISADWNRHPDKAVRILERRYGFHVEWSDTVASCADCYGAIRTEPDTYWWRPRYGYSDGEVVCGACLRRSGLRWDDRERWPEILDPARLASVGVSADTLRPADLAERFAVALRDAGRGVLSDAEWSDLEEWERGPRQTCLDKAAWYADAVEWMSDRLAECAPDGYFFGLHPSDGACFGFWPEDADA